LANTALRLQLLSLNLISHKDHSCLAADHLMFRAELLRWSQLRFISSSAKMRSVCFRFLLQFALLIILLHFTFVNFLNIWLAASSHLKTLPKFI